MLIKTSALIYKRRSLTNDVDAGDDDLAYALFTPVAQELQKELR